MSAPRRAEAALLAAIHVYAAAQAPRLRHLLPDHGAEGDAILLAGEGLDGELRVRFGAVETWAVSLGPRLALAVVPAAATGPVVVQKGGLRSNPLAFGRPPGDGPSRIVRIDPQDGAYGVFCDAPVVARLSHPADLTTVGAHTLQVEDDIGLLPGVVLASPDAHVLVWRPMQPLRPGIEHVVRAEGLRDQRGRPVDHHRSWFVPCALAWSDLAN